MPDRRLSSVEDHMIGRRSHKGKTYIYNEGEVMARAISRKKKREKLVTFALKTIDARQVHLVGDFNNWNMTEHLMENDGNGIWVKQLLLPEGKFEYKFLVDDKWVADPQNERVCANCFGTMNNIINVTI
jgi:1,4-alpha-glucan branching enzyme